MSDQENIDKVAQSSLRSLLTQTGQVAIGFGAMLVATGGQPSEVVLGLTVAGGVAFVAVAEEQRLTKKHQQLVEKHRLELEAGDRPDGGNHEIQ